MRTRRLRLPLAAACLAIAAPLFAGEPTTPPAADAPATAQVKAAASAAGHSVADGAKSATHAAHRAAKRTGHATRRAWNKAKARISPKSAKPAEPAPAK